MFRRLDTCSNSSLASLISTQRGDHAHRVDYTFGILKALEPLELEPLERR